MTDEIIQLQLAKGLYCTFSRIGYEDEGIRLTFFDTIPYKAHYEVQLSKKDAENILRVLQETLDEEVERNLK